MSPPKSRTLPPHVLQRFWLIEELLAIASRLREHELWLVILAGLILWTLVYQLPYFYQVDIGGNRATHQRGFDKPFIGQSNNISYGGGFNGEEPGARNWYELDQAPYRWTESRATVHFPGVGDGKWLVAVRALPPANIPTMSRWSDDTTTTEIELRPGPEGQPRIHHILANSNRDGDLVLHFITPRFQVQSDPRDLGFVMYGITLQSIGGSRLPALPQLAMLAVTLTFAYLGVRRLGVSRRWGLVGGLGIAIGLALLLARWRLDFTIFVPTLLAIVVGCYGFMLIVLRFFAFEFRQVAPTHLQPVRWHLPVPAILITLAFALRVGGLLHPYAWQSDVGLNANNLVSVVTGQVYFTEPLPARAGGGEAPYPPAQYLMHAPALLLLKTDFWTRQVLLMVGNAFWDATIVGLLWYTLLQARVSERAASFAAMLYVVATPMLNRLSIGELANVYGQALALPFLIGLGIAPQYLRNRYGFIIYLLLLFIALLGHSGVTISLGLVLMCLVPLWLLVPGQHLPVKRLLQVIAISVGLACILYYSAFFDIVIARLSSGFPTFTSSRSSYEKFNALLSNFGTPIYQITPLMFILGAVGIAFLKWRQAHNDQRTNSPLWLLLLAWWGGAFLSILPLVVRDQTVRWEAFLFPALCLGAGPILALMWSRGRVGRLISITLLSFLLWRGIALWYHQIITYRP